MTSLNRDRVVTDFRKVKDLLTKTFTFLSCVTDGIKASELKLLDRII